jgi:hypothetical protein
MVAFEASFLLLQYNIKAGSDQRTGQSPIVTLPFGTP